MDDPSIFGPDAPARPFSIDGYFDSQLQDRLNLGLHEDLLNVLCGVCIALIILLLTDIISRSVVRIDPNAVNIFALYRATLLSFSTSLLHWFPDLFLRTHRNVHRQPWQGRVLQPKQKAGDHSTEHRTEEDSASSLSAVLEPPHVLILSDSNLAGSSFLVKEQPDDAFSKRQSSAATFRRARATQFSIILAGFSLTAVHFALIFLSTNRNDAVPIDKTRLPSLALVPELRDLSRLSNASLPPPKLLVEPQTICTQHPVTGGRIGFKSLASVSLCREVEPGVRLEPRLSRTEASLLLLGRGRYVSIGVGTRHFTEKVYLASAVNLWGGHAFDIRSTVVNGTAVLRALRAVLELRGFRILNVSGSDGVGYGETKWTFMVRVSFTPQMRVPGNVRETMNLPLYREVLLNETNPHRVPVHDIAWTRYIASIVCSLFDFHGGGRAFDSLEDMKSLEKDSGVLVRRERPWLNLVGCMAMVGVLFFIWAAIALRLRWQAGVEYCAGWGDRFLGISTLRELANVLHETLSKNEEGSMS